MSIFWQSESTLQGTHTPHLVSLIKLMLAHFGMPYLTIESWILIFLPKTSISGPPTRSRTSSPTLYSMPTPAQLVSLEQRLVTLS